MRNGSVVGWGGREGGGGEKGGGREGGGGREERGERRGRGERGEGRRERKRGGRKKRVLLRRGREGEEREEGHTLEQLEEKNGHIATGYTGLGQLVVVVSLLSWLDEGQEGEGVVSKREDVGHCTLPCSKGQKLLSQQSKGYQWRVGRACIFN